MYQAVTFHSYMYNAESLENHIKLHASKKFGQNTILINIYLSLMSNDMGFPLCCLWVKLFTAFS